MRILLPLLLVLGIWGSIAIASQVNTTSSSGSLSLDTLPALLGDTGDTFTQSLNVLTNLGNLDLDLFNSTSRAYTPPIAQAKWVKP